MTIARRGGLAVACFLALAPGAGAEECAAGRASVDVLVVNMSGAPVTASLRQARSEDDWRTLKLGPDGKEVLSACLQMVLSVASAEFRVADETGAELCAGSNFISAGAEANLMVAADGACALKVEQ